MGGEGNLKKERIWNYIICDDCGSTPTASTTPGPSPSTVVAECETADDCPFADKHPLCTDRTCFQGTCVYSAMEVSCGAGADGECFLGDKCSDFACIPMYKSQGDVCSLHDDTEWGAMPDFNSDCHEMRCTKPDQAVSFTSCKVRGALCCFALLLLAITM
jgi:hypothetical protein